MSHLVYVDLSGNGLNPSLSLGLSGLIPSLPNATSLVNLTLDNNNFSGFEEPFSFNAPNLQDLNIAGNQLAGTIPLAITKLLNLTIIDLSRNLLSGSIPSGFSNLMHDYFWLDLSQNQLSVSIPLDLVEPEPRALTDAISDNFYFYLINISFNSLHGSIPTPSTSRILNTTIDYQYGVDISHNLLEGSIPSQLSELSYLDVRYNRLSGDVVDFLLTSRLQPVATGLYLGQNPLTGDLTRMTSDWARWSVLGALDLSNTSLSWRPVESIRDPISAALDNISFHLFWIWISGNNFSGTSLPMSPLSRVNGTLDSLSTLDLSDNQLDEVISSDVFNSTWMPNLLSLNLSYNRVTGAFPESIISLRNLDILELSNNNLSGQLPFVPWNSSLSDPRIFMNNTPDLCGYPLPECLKPEPVLSQTGLHLKWWELFLIVGGLVTIAITSCLVATWRWRVYRRRHQQDVDLIRTLMEREVVTIMPLRHLRKATDGFAESARIGEGGFGTVYRGNLPDGTTVAIKRGKREGSERDKEQFLNEVKILSQVNHRHLVKLLGCCMENEIALLVFEFVSNGTLESHVRGAVGDGRLTWQQRLTIAVQTADALDYLHSAAMFPIYHRNVKSANILLNDDLSANARR